MKVITQFEAAQGGYRAVTTDVHPRREEAIKASIESTLGRDPDAVWIKQDNGELQAARKATKLTATTKKS